MMFQITLLQKISLKNLSRPASFIHITRGLHLVPNIIKFSQLNEWRISFSCFSAKAWNCLPSRVCNAPKLAFKKSIAKALFAALDGDEAYIEAPSLLSKINLYLT